MKLGMNIGHELLSGVEYSPYVIEDARLWKLSAIDFFRIAMTDYSNANAVILIQKYLEELQSLLPGKSFLYGINKRGNKWRASLRDELWSKHVEAAKYAQLRGVALQLGNEDSSEWCREGVAITESVKKGNTITCSTAPIPHGFKSGELAVLDTIGPIVTVKKFTKPLQVLDAFTFKFIITTATLPDGRTIGGTVKPDATVVRDFYIQLAAYLRSIGITIPFFYSMGQGLQGDLEIWKAGCKDIGLCLNVYGEGNAVASRLANFKDHIDKFLTIPQPTGLPKMVTEYGLHADFDKYPETYFEQVSEWSERMNYMKGKIDVAYPFCWRSNSWSGSKNDRYAIRLTWDQTGFPLGLRWSELFKML